ncbi:Calx-beta domain-containing protein [uncultured Kordia sp.]|uniref:DUF7619 domain-containing protein n=1 Tax=uncultured Kordia sp. TaxID=507699 RepID=UPI002608505F|nr:Calx-beta domain-containing protein [uncultured Kordia sp.]
MKLKLPLYFFLLFFSISLANTIDSLKEYKTTADKENLVMSTVSIENVTVFESDASAVVQITLDVPDTVDTVINISTMDNTAVSPNDYTAIASTVTIPAGQTSIDISASIIDDILVETTEYFNIQGTVTSGNTSNTNISSEITIIDQDDSYMSISNETVNESDGTAFVSISIDSPSSSNIVISITTVDNSAIDPNDYTATTATATIPAGQLSVDVGIPILDDFTGEPTEDFTVNATVTSGNIANSNDSATVTIIDDDTPAMTMTDASVNEDAGTATITINLTNPSSVDTIININTVSDTANSPNDYTSIISTATIAAGDISADVGIVIIDDAIDEDTETFSLTGVVITGNTSNSSDSGTITINDNDDCTTNPLADCDGDGVTNQDESNPPNGLPPTDPENPCDLNVSDITLPQTGDYLFSDCDGDGVTSEDELNPPNGLPPTDPFEPCDFNPSDVTVQQSGEYFIADCDGDGVVNYDELNPPNGGTPTDVLNPCDFNVDDISVQPSGDYFTVDCDGDGVINGDELNPPNGGMSTNPNDLCDFNSDDITVEVSEEYLMDDCDNDGTINALDCDPFDDSITDGMGDACDDGDSSTTSDFIDENCNCIGLATSDVDGDGISNQQEVIDGTDYNNPCDPVQAVGYTSYDADNSVWQAGNCDNDDLNNALEVILGSDPYDTNYNSIQGITTHDVNNDGCTNGTDDIVLPNTRININNGTTTEAVFTNNAGEYVYYATTGNYTITPNLENPTFFNVSPVSASTNFASTNNSVFNQDFCITSNGVNPDVEVVIAPIEFARPGFDAEYVLTYRNKGNQLMSGTINFMYDDTVLDFVSSTEMTSSQTTGILNWNYTDLAPFESRSINIILNVNGPTESPAVFNGDQLEYTATITPVAGDVLPDDNQFIYEQTVVGSYDPNDITCLEGSIVNPTEIGEYLHYVINFENTGTFFAENIVVEMDIDPVQFDINTLRLLSSSHDASIVINGATIRFIFQNIFLPVDGHGNLLLKIKSQNTLVENDMVSNDARIFFDYNFPIQTNDAETTYAILSTEQFEEDRSITIYPNPTRDNIFIEGNSAIKSIEIYDIQGSMLMQESYNSKNINLNMSNQAAGIYFIKIKTDKGVKTEKVVKM